MTKIVSAFGAIAIILGVLLQAGAAQAQATFVSGVGNDANPCTRASPCATFNRAYAVAGDPGQISVLDGGDFGVLSIGHSLTIANDGAGTATNTPIFVSAAISIDAGSGNVVLRGLNLFNVVGFNFPGPAIDFQSGASLLIDHCTIQNFVANAGILFENHNGARLWVKDTTLSTDGARSGASVWIKPNSGAVVNANFERVQVLGATGNGIRVDGTNGGGIIHVVLRDVTVDEANGGSGIVAVSATSGGAPVEILADEVTSSNNAGYGVRAVGATASVSLTRSTIADNTVGIAASSGGAMVSYSNNTFSGNGSDGAPTTTMPLK